MVHCSHGCSSFEFPFERKIYSPCSHYPNTDISKPVHLTGSFVILSLTHDFRKNLWDLTVILNNVIGSKSHRQPEKLWSKISNFVVGTLPVDDWWVLRYDHFEVWAPFQYPIRRLIVRSREVSKPRDWYLELCDSSEIWQAPRQHCCRCACQISMGYCNLN